MPPIEKLQKIIEDGMRKEVEREFDVLAKKLFKDLNRRKNEICAGILMEVMLQVHFDSRGEEVVFTVKEIKKNA